MPQRAGAYHASSLASLHAKVTDERRQQRSPFSAPRQQTFRKGGTATKLHMLARGEMGLLTPYSSRYYSRTRVMSITPCSRIVRTTLPRWGRWSAHGFLAGSVLRPLDARWSQKS